MKIRPNMLMLNLIYYWRSYSSILESPEWPNICSVGSPGLRPPIPSDRREYANPSNLEVERVSEIPYVVFFVSTACEEVTRFYPQIV